MGYVLTVVDGVLFLFFLVFSVVSPLFDAQCVLPQQIYPKVLRDILSWYENEYGDYLFTEKPNFFVGLVWMELLVAWPLALINVYALLSSKPWFHTPCLIFGASMGSGMVAVLSELTKSDKASDTLKMIYYPFLGIAVLAFLRGLFSSRTPTIGKRPVPLPRKKTA